MAQHDTTAFWRKKRLLLNASTDCGWMIIGTSVKALMLPARFIDASTGLLRRSSLLNQSYRSARSPSFEILSAVCWQIPSWSLRHGNRWIIQRTWPEKPSNRTASKTAGNLLLQDDAKSFVPHSAAARTIMGGPNATRKRFTRHPRIRKSRDCITKNSKAASSPSCEYNFTSSTISLSCKVCSDVSSGRRCRSPPWPGAVPLDDAAGAPFGCTDFLGRRLSKQLKKQRMKTKMQVRAAAGAAVDSRYTFADDHSKSLKTPMFK